jgi:hypothetical protein
MTQRNKPIKVFRAGSVTGSIWEEQVQRNGKAVTQHSVSFQRRFRRKDGRYSNAKGYWPRDLPRLQLVAGKCYEYITLVESKDAEPA